MASAPLVAFVHPGASAWQDWRSRECPPDPDEAPQRFRTGRDHALTQVFFRLRRRGHDVVLTDRPLPGAVCILHCDDVQLRQLPFRSFVVAIQNDRFRPSLCDLCVVPRAQLAASARDHFVQFYTQAGMIKRDGSRGTQVRSVAFFGIRRNLAPEYQAGGFLDALHRWGIDFVIKDRDWHDYSGVDAMLAVRTNYTQQFLQYKPPLKLLNAWMAGVPALLGPEPGFRDLRRTALDYLEVATPQQALAAVDRLRAEPSLYERMVANGLERAKDYSHERVTQDWERFLTGPVAAAYAEWQRARTLLRAPGRVAKWLFRALRHRADRKRWWDESWWLVPDAQVLRPG